MEVQEIPIFHLELSSSAYVIVPPAPAAKNRGCKESKGSRTVAVWNNERTTADVSTIHAFSIEGVQSSASLNFLNVQKVYRCIFTPIFCNQYVYLVHTPLPSVIHNTVPVVALKRCYSKEYQGLLQGKLSRALPIV